jgi:hypothetical protein
VDGFSEGRRADSTLSKATHYLSKQRRFKQHFVSPGAIDSGTRQRAVAATHVVYVQGAGVTNFILF